MSLTASIIVFLLLVIGLFWYWTGYWQNTKTVEQGSGADDPTKVVEQEAQDPTAGWLKYEDQGAKFSFRYPEDFGAKVWHAYFWPPKAAAIPAGFDPVSVGCPDLAPAGASSTKPQGESIRLGENGLTFYTSADIGAGSLYSTYCYIAKQGDRSIALEFTIQSHTGCTDGQCGAYCETPDEAECRAFDLVHDVQRPIKEIVSTLELAQ